MNQKTKLISRISAVMFCMLLFIGCSPSSSENNEEEFAAAYQFVCNNLDENNWEYLNSDSSLRAQLDADIRLAIGTCRTQLNNGSLPREVFYEYLLAPSVNTERFDDWRSKCLSTFSHLQNDTSDIETVLNSLNSELEKQFTFQNERTKKEYNWSTYQQDNNMRGTCWDMATIVLFPLRALGYAATIDFTPAWGNSDGWHSWNTVYVNGKMTPFMGIERNINYNPFGIVELTDNPANYSYRRPGKVFRMTLSDNKTYRRIKDKYPSLSRLSIFNKLKFKDVTSEYFCISNLIVKRPQDYLGDVLFLSVFSGGRWMETCAAEVSEDGYFTFSDMNREMIYLLVKPDGMTVEAPWILDKDGEVTELMPDFQDTGDVEISHLLLFKTDYYYRTPPEENRIYRLYTYRSKWIMVGQARATRGKLVFKDIPKRGLMMLTDELNMPIGRPFTYKDRKCQWW